MYTEEDIKKFLSVRGEIEMELGVCRAQYHNREDTVPLDIQQHIDQLERYLLTMDSMLCALTTNERFVVQAHIIENLDWSQVLGEFVKKWGTDSEKNDTLIASISNKSVKKSCARSKPKGSPTMYSHGMRKCHQCSDTVLIWDKGFSLPFVWEKHGGSIPNDV